MKEITPFVGMAAVAAVICYRSGSKRTKERIACGWTTMQMWWMLAPPEHAWLTPFIGMAAVAAVMCYRKENHPS